MDSSAPSAQALLFEPLTVRGVTFRNRTMVSPMCMYSATDGRPNDYHLVHLGRFALGGFGLVFAEATSVEARGRISLGDAGLWSDEQIEPWRRVTDFVRAYGAVPGVQLAHAGRKASTIMPWDGGTPLAPTDAAGQPLGWETVGPAAIPAKEDWPSPAQLSVGEIGELVAAWRDAARRACEAGFEVIEVHGAHGYLIHSFLSPISNTREDEYGGDLGGRMRFALEIASAVREAWPEHLPLFWRVSALDGIDGGWTMEDTILLCHELQQRGVDVIDTSSGGISMDPSSYHRIRRGYAFHTPYSTRIREETGMCTATVGLIVDPVQAEDILQQGEADIIAIGREALANPQWAHDARAVLVGDGFGAWPKKTGWWLEVRAPTLRRLEEAGESPRGVRHGTPIGPPNAEDVLAPPSEPSRSSVRG